MTTAGFYMTGNKKKILYFQNTAVSGARGLAVGDPVTSIGGCLVTSIKDWNSCLAQSIREQSYGNCVPVSMIDELDTARKKKLGKWESKKPSYRKICPEDHHLASRDLLSDDKQ